MAQKTWLGGAATQVQVDSGTVVVAGTPADNTFIVTLTDESGQAHALAAVPGDTDATTTAEAIVADFNASFDTEHRKVTASNTLGVVSFTADTAGVPFHLLCTVAGVGDGTFTRDVVTANKGPNDFNVPENFLEGVVPADADDVTILGDYDILYGLWNLLDPTLNRDSIELNSFKTDPSSRANIGAGPKNYLVLDLDSNDVNLYGQGQAFLDIDKASNIYIWNAPAGADDYYGLNIIGDDQGATTVVYIHTDDGSVAFAPQLGQQWLGGAALYASGSGLDLYLGDHDITSVFCYAGATIHNHDALTSLNMYAGTFHHHEPQAITTVKISNGAVLHNYQTCAFTTTYLWGGARISVEEAVGLLTLTNLYMHAGSVLDWRNGLCNFSNPIEFPGCAIQDCVLNGPANYKYTPAGM